MVGTVPFTFFGSTGGGAILHQYSTPGTYSEVIPSGTSQVVIEVWGPGGGGCGGDAGGPDPGNGGSSGAYAIKTVAITSSNWGYIFDVIVGVPGSGGNGSSGGSQNSGTNATNSQCANNLGAPTVNINNTYGVKGTAIGGGTGNTPTGGDTNTQGNAGQDGVSGPGGGGAGGTAIIGVHGTAGAGGKGGDAGNHAGSPGSAGLVSFYYT